MFGRDSDIDNLTACEPDVSAVIEQGNNVGAHTNFEGEHALFSARFYVDHLGIGKEARSAIKRGESPFGYDSIWPKPYKYRGELIVLQDCTPCNGQRKINAVAV